MTADERFEYLLQKPESEMTPEDFQELSDLERELAYPHMDELICLVFRELEAAGELTQYTVH